jgi:hypothetical protein
MAHELSSESRLLAAEWFAEYGERVIAALVAAYPDVDPDLRHDAFVKGLLEIAQKPEAMDPERGTMLDLLIGAARRALRGLWRSDTSRRQRDEKKGKMLVAQRQAAARDILDVLADKELAPLIRAELALTDEEERYLALWEQGTEDQVEIARALGTEHLSPDEQEMIRLRLHKRIMKRLERIRKRRSGEENRP